eukprot:521457-Amphidinium_carterae.1
MPVSFMCNSGKCPSNPFSHKLSRPTVPEMLGNNPHSGIVPSWSNASALVVKANSHRLCALDSVTRTYSQVHSAQIEGDPKKVHPKTDVLHNTNPSIGTTVSWNL